MRRSIPAAVLAAVISGGVLLGSLGRPSNADEPPPTTTTTRPNVPPAAAPPAGTASAVATRAAEKNSAEKSRAEKSPAEQEQEPLEPSIWMKKKLDYSQEILAGLATADFERIDKNAGLMKGLGKVEAFVRGRTPGYRAQYQIFQEATDELGRQAAKKNVDGAALAFTQLTISCVNCHKQLRESAKK